MTNEEKLEIITEISREVTTEAVTKEIADELVLRELDRRIDWTKSIKSHSIKGGNREMFEKTLDAVINYDEEGFRGYDICELPRHALVGLVEEIVDLCNPEIASKFDALVRLENAQLRKVNLDGKGFVVLCSEEAGVKAFSSGEEVPVSEVPSVALGVCRISNKRRRLY